MSLGGLCFKLIAADRHLISESDDAYRPFVLAPDAPDDGESIDVCVSVAECTPPSGRLLFDTGAWGIYAQGQERCVVVRPPSLPEPLCQARFRPGAPRVEMVCTPRFLVSEGGVTRIRDLFHYPLDQVLTTYLLGERGLVLHAAGFDWQGSGVALPGVSGAGKSTITRLLAHGSGAHALSDDRVILSVRGDDVLVHGTPWPGEAGVAEHRQVKAGHLLFLEQGGRNDVRAISARETLARLLPTASVPWFDADCLESGLRACEAIIARVPAGVFTFRNDAQAVDVLAAFLAGRGAANGRDA